MNKTSLITQIREKRSYLCVGLDPDLQKIPSILKHEKEPVLTFLKEIIDSTSAYAIAYKPNLAFFEAMGPRGWEILEQVKEHIPKKCFSIADAKRGDIGNTSKKYAETFFQTYDFDAVTVAPYMGADSVEPFLSFPDKWCILLALTSNSGALNFELQKLENGQYLFEQVIQEARNWGTDENLMFVVGATQNEYLTRIRKIIPKHFLLIPGVGAQGGDLANVSRLTLTNEIGIIINSSRQILYASSDADYAAKAGNEASLIQKEMDLLLKEKGL
jgi:orotidine-5'-phosphate decarboxylase